MKEKRPCCPNKCDMTGPELLEVMGLVTFERPKTRAEQMDELARLALVPVDEPPICPGKLIGR